MAPAVELRGGVPVRRLGPDPGPEPRDCPLGPQSAARLLSCQVGNWLGLSPLVTFVICVAGNMLPILPTLLALRSEAVKKESFHSTHATHATHATLAIQSTLTTHVCCVHGPW